MFVMWKEQKKERGRVLPHCLKWKNFIVLLNKFLKSKHQVPTILKWVISQAEAYLTVLTIAALGAYSN